MPTNSERSGLTYFIADLLKVLPGGADQTASWPNWKHLQPIKVMERVTKALSHKRCLQTAADTHKDDIKKAKG